MGWGRPQERSEPRSPQSRFLVVKVAQQEFLLSVGVVREIIHAPLMTSLPRTSPEILGIISLRGEMLPVLDLDRILGLSAPSEHAPLRCLILSSARGSFGLLVDDVEEFTHLLPHELGLMTSESLAEEFRVVSSVAMDGELARPVLDIELILSTVFGERKSDGNESH
jgi:chemotaxis signal transduction protein